MDDCTPKIVVAGDVSVDWLYWPAPPADAGLSWQLCQGSRWAALPGGALLMAELLRRAGGVAVSAPYPIVSPLCRLSRFSSTRERVTWL